MRAGLSNRSLHPHHTFPGFLVLLIIVVLVSHDLHYTAMVRECELGVDDNRARHY